MKKERSAASLILSSELLLLLVFVFLAAGHLYSPVQGAVHYHDFVLREKNFTRLCSSRSVLVVNDSFPGPVIRVRKGDTLFVNVHNQGDYGITIHWHGVKQPRNSWSDGPEYITQCPIPPGTNFTYEVIFSKEEGTLWWHAHSDWSRWSVHGAIVVYPVNETTYPFPTPDDEQILVLGSWYKINVNEVVDEDLKTGADTPRSVAYVINGQPGDFCNCSKESTFRWVVDFGKTYLVRLVNAAMNAEHYLAIANHNVTVVGMDGNYVKPFVTSYIMISPGQTMDLLLTANQTLGHYYIVAHQYDTVVPEAINYDHANASAILMYSGNYTPPEVPVYPSQLPYYEDLPPADAFLAKLRSLANEQHPIDVPRNITTRMYITVSMNEIICPSSTCERTSGTALSSSLNNISFLNPDVDVLQAYYGNLSGFYTPDFPDWPPTMFNFTEDDLPSNVTLTIQATKVKLLDYNKDVEITFQGTETLDASENHPMHLHGYSFYVVGSGIGNFNNVTDPLSYNLVDPVELTTVRVPMKGWVTIRFKASNPGVWLWHCHLDRHLSWGMDTVMIVKNGGTPETSLRSPPSYMPKCKVPHKHWIQSFDDDSSEDEELAQLFRQR